MTPNTGLKLTTRRSRVACCTDEPTRYPSLRLYRCNLCAGLCDLLLYVSRNHGMSLFLQLYPWAQCASGHSIDFGEESGSFLFTCPSCAPLFESPSDAIFPLSLHPSYPHPLICHLAPQPGPRTIPEGSRLVRMSVGGGLGCRLLLPWLLFAAFQATAK